MEYIMMLLFTNIEPFFIFIQSLLGGGAESCGKNRIRQKYNEFRDGRRKPWTHRSPNHRPRRGVLGLKTYLIRTLRRAGGGWGRGD